MAHKIKFLGFLRVEGIPKSYLSHVEISEQLKVAVRMDSLPHTAFRNFGGRKKESATGGKPRRICACVYIYILLWIDVCILVYIYINIIILSWYIYIPSDWYNQCVLISRGWSTYSNSLTLECLGQFGRIPTNSLCSGHSSYDHQKNNFEALCTLTLLEICEKKSSRLCNF